MLFWLALLGFAALVWKLSDDSRCGNAPGIAPMPSSCAPDLPHATITSSLRLSPSLQAMLGSPHSAMDAGVHACSSPS